MVNSICVGPLGNRSDTIHDQEVVVRWVSQPLMDLVLATNKQQQKKRYFGSQLDLRANLGPLFIEKKNWI